MTVIRKTLLVAATLATTLAACSSSTSHTTTTTTTTARAPGPTLPAGVSSDASVPTNVANNPALRGNVQISNCAATAGGWEAVGRALNPSSTAVTYTITVFFTTAQATVIGTGQTKVLVKANGRAAWDVTAKFTAAPGTLCVLRGVG